MKSLRWNDEQLDAHLDRMRRDKGITHALDIIDQRRGAEAVPRKDAAVPSLDRESSVAVAPMQSTFLDLRGFAFELAMPPSVNAAWHFIRDTGGKTLTDEHRQFRRDTIARVRQVMGSEGPLGGRLELVLRLTFANRRRADIDNRVKPLQDALTHARAYWDDSQIDRLVVERFIGNEEKCAVILRELGA